MMRAETRAKVEEARRSGRGTGWTDFYFYAPVSYSTMKKYPDVFETREGTRTFTSGTDAYDDSEYEEWTVSYKEWRFKK